MNTTSLIALLQALAVLLTGIQNSNQVSPALAARAVTATSQAIQLAAQVEVAPKITFSIPQNTSIWPNIVDLVDTAYLDGNGNYVPATATDIVLDQGTTSFGDLNGDGLDDAAMVVQQTAANGSSTYALAAMLNQGGIMFNIADIDLGQSVTVYSHHILNGQIILDMQINNQARATYTYQLFGTTLSLVSKVSD